MAKPVAARAVLRYNPLTLMTRLGMKQIAALLTMTLWLAGCSSGPPLFTSDGRATQRVVCGAQDSAWQDCFAQAHAQCGGRDYDVVSRSSDGAPRSILIACR
jgi:starvation-inducible outer membrane lipoprotein